MFAIRITALAHSRTVAWVCFGWLKRREAQSTQEIQGLIWVGQKMAPLDTSPLFVVAFQIQPDSSHHLRVVFLYNPRIHHLLDPPPKKTNHKKLVVVLRLWKGVKDHLLDPPKKNTRSLL